MQTRGSLLATLQRNPGLLLTRRLSDGRGGGARRSARTGGCSRPGTGTASCASPTCGPGSRRDRRCASTAPSLEQAMQFAPDGRTVAVGSGRGNRTDVHFVDVAARRARRVRSWPGPVTTIDAQTLLLAYAPDGRRPRRRAGDLRRHGRLVHRSQRLALLDARSGRTVWERAYPSMRKDQHEVHVGFTPERRADHLRLAGRDARLGRATRAGSCGATRSAGGSAISPDGEHVAISLNGPELRRPAHGRRGAEPADRPSPDPGRQPAEHRLRRPGVQPRRHADHRRHLRGHVRLGREDGQRSSRRSTRRAGGSVTASCSTRRGGHCSGPATASSACGTRTADGGSGAASPCAASNACTEPVLGDRPRAMR